MKSYKCLITYICTLEDTEASLRILDDGEFKNMVEMALDPVCNMSVDRKSAPAETEWNGITYYFCANGCREDFLIDPEKYLKPVTPQEIPT